MWRKVSSSVQGTSHKSTGLPCQDRAFCEVFSVGGSFLLVGAIADGAGSAKFSEIGAETAVVHCKSSIEYRLNTGHNIFEKRELEDLIVSIRSEIEKVSAKANCSIREFATTFLLCILSDQDGVIVQIGDGAIVVEVDGTLFMPIEPMIGEYRNETMFLTDPDYSSKIKVFEITRKVDGLVMLSDGLQDLAINFSNKTIHKPFFQNLLLPMTTSVDFSEEYTKEALQKYLTSTIITSRCDDDLSLVIAKKVGK